jgi:TetR/AcrR family transcriptional repressor of nem operon
MCHEAADSPLRQTFMVGLNRLLDNFGSLMDSPDAPLKRQQALVQYSLMVGALILARATRGDALSEELLAAATRFLIEEQT